VLVSCVCVCYFFGCYCLLCGYSCVWILACVPPVSVFLLALFKFLLMCVLCVYVFLCLFLRYSGGIFLNVVDLLHHVCLLLCCVCFTSVRITCVGVYVCVCVCVVMWLGNN